MDLWADDFELPPAHPPRRRDPRKVILAALVAAIVLVGVITVLVRDDDRPEHVAAAQDDGASASTTTVEDVTTTTTIPEVATTAEAGPSTTVAGIPVHPEGDQVIRGRVVDPDGFPIEGVYVYPRFQDRPWTRTDADGRCVIPCWQRPVLLTGAPINTISHDAAGRVTNLWMEDQRLDKWFVPTVPQVAEGAGSCGTDPAVVITVMQRSGAIHGVIRDPDAYADPSESEQRHVRVFVELPGYDLVPTATVCVPFCTQLSGMSYPPERPGPEATIPSERRYRIVGIPPGDVRVAVPDPAAPNGYAIQTVRVEAGQSVQIDLDPSV